VGAHYYLLSSLPALSLEMKRGVPEVRQVFLYCGEQLGTADFEQVRRLFLFNDIKNTVFFHFNDRKSNRQYMSPAYYDEATYVENLKDPASFFPFLARFHELAREERRIYPDLPYTDEVTAFFYDDLDELVDGFLAEWYRFELDLRNATVALAHRQNGLPITEKLIPSGLVWEAARRDPSVPDLGLGSSFPALGELVAWEGGLTGYERLIEDLRWRWLDERTQGFEFTTDQVLAYLVRLMSVTRWHGLRAEDGEAAFQKLMDTVSRSIRSSVQFATSGEQQP
jgi:hypothetical protein